MRARNRQSASNYLFAAFLELVIMGIFVVIAQPQLRESLFEMLEGPARAIAPQPPAQADAAAVAPGARDDAGYTAPYDSLEVPVQLVPARLAPAQSAGWAVAAASYAPLDHFEAFTVSTDGAALPAASAEATAATRVAGYAPAAGATQLDAIDWTIASAAQSPRPLSGWTPSRPADPEYRAAYPPPYGTQSQWK